MFSSAAPPRRDPVLVGAPADKAPVLALLERVRNIQDPDAALNAIISPGNKEYSVLVASVLLPLLDEAAKTEALFGAVSAGDAPLVAALLGAGAIGTVPGKRPYASALDQAAADNKAEIAEILLVSGQFEVNAMYDDRYTALHHAASEKAADAILVLLYYGADITKKTWGGGSVQELTRESSARRSDAREALVSYRLRKENKLGPMPKAVPPEVRALHAAAESKNLAALNAVLEESPGAVDGLSYRGHTALWGAARDGWLEGVKALLAAGADPDAKDRRGETAVNAAFLSGVPLVQTFADAGANMNVKRRRRWLLQRAVSNGNASLVAALRSGPNPALLCLLDDEARVAVRRMEAS